MYCNQVRGHGPPARGGIYPPGGVRAICVLGSWADDASLLVWHQLAASIDQLPLLLIATCRSDPGRPEVQQVRASLARRGGALVTLGPLPETDVADLVTAVLGTPPGDTLRQLAAQAAGNPLYLRELVDSLARERAQASPVGVWSAHEQLPASLAAVLNEVIARSLGE
jgi:predicted ATPase